MPIRTTRGRAAAYRSVWQWPLRSPARLVVTLVVVATVAALVGVGAAAANGNRSGGGLVAAPAPTSAPSVPSPSSFGSTGATTARSTPTVLPPVPRLSPTTLPVSQAPPVALQVARRWATSWVRPLDGTPAATWLDGLRPTTTDEYLGVLSGVDPSNIPATKITGAPRAVRVASRSVQVDVPTDALTLRVTVVVTDAGDWKVSGYGRA